MATFLLVHGSWHGAWCWREVAAGLRSQGHEVFAPTLSGCAERFHHGAETVTLQTHVRDVAGLLFYEDLRDVILVAHSYAGMVAQGVANAAPERLAGIVYLDAYVVPPGSKGFDLWTPERLLEARQSIEGGYPYRKPFAPDFLGITDPALAAHVAERLTPHPLATYDAVLEPESAAAERLARVYVQCTEGPIAPIFAPIAEAVRARGWRIEQLAAPHDAMLTHPQELVQLLLALAPGLLKRQAPPSAESGEISIPPESAIAPPDKPPRYAMKLYVDDTISISPEEVEAKYLARFRDLVDDQEVFADIKSPEGRRRHFHVISENGHLGPAKITTPHHFHISYLEVPPGMSAALHAHDAPEVFIPMTGKFALLYGDHGEHAVEMDPFDTFSVPIGVMRTFKNIGITSAILMVIYDGPGEVLGKIFVNEETAEAMRKNTPQVARDFGLFDA